MLEEQEQKCGRKPHWIRGWRHGTGDGTTRTLVIRQKYSKEAEKWPSPDMGCAQNQIFSKLPRGIHLPCKAAFFGSLTTKVIIPQWRDPALDGAESQSLQVVSSGKCLRKE